MKYSVSQKTWILFAEFMGLIVHPLLRKFQRDLEQWDGHFFRDKLTDNTVFTKIRQITNTARLQMKQIC